MKQTFYGKNMNKKLETIIKGQARNAVENSQLITINPYSEGLEEREIWRMEYKFWASWLGSDKPVIASNRKWIRDTYAICGSYGDLISWDFEKFGY